MPKKHTLSNKVRKRKSKDLDQIHEDLKPEKAIKLMNQEVDFDVAGDAQHYCIECNRYFIDDITLGKHKKTKVHKNQVKRLKDEPYTQKEADAAGGLGS
ncbi:unnamed protein product [Bursaphelenchus okinawaensis]|uniref:Zinc finger protein 593 homolog n=1 Tax=Bursaphelenchus okinawaensis TaxID=465554 RepID=A0A811KVU5_9BILA|nr:unnamed protein product [Bursaphelenchus okinawaensis]CAG9112772.1 unnamed protein product [Bursaphelenchus okinawaensis]